MTKAGSRVTRFALVAALVGGALSSSVQPASAAAILNGTARGEGVQVVPLAGTVVHLAQAKSEVDSNGIGAGTNVAHGTAKPAEVVASGAAKLEAAESETSAPPGSSDSDGVPSATLPAVLSVSALSSGSSADSLPRSTNSARIEQSSVLTSVVSTGVITGASESRRSGDDSLSTASASVANLSVGIVGIPAISVTAATASASALATGIAPNLPGGSKGQVLSCSVADVQIGTVHLVNIPCDGRELVPPILQTLLSIKAGTATTAATPTTASAKVDALTITIKLTGQTIILGSVDVAAALETAPPASPCVFPARPTASGSATGDVVQVSDLLTRTTADVALSQTRIDEAGVGGGPKTATADGMIGQVSQPTVPLLAQVIDNHATAPPATSGATTVADASISPLLTSKTIHTDASATANANGFAPSGTADATAETAGATVGALASLSSTTITSSATSTRNPTNVTSAGSSGVDSTTGTVAGLPLNVQALKSTSNASATGSTGGATASNSFQVATVQLGTLNITAAPPAGSTFDVLSPGLALVRLTFGVGTTTTAPDGTSASASMDALRIQVLPLGTGSALETIVIGHSDAAARVPQAAFAGFVSKKVSVAFDEPRTFVDGPVSVAPGQKLTYVICYANLGSTTLDQFVITDPLNSALVRPYDALFPLPPNTSIVGGTAFNGTTLGGTLTSAPFSLAPGQTGSIQFTMEVVQGTPTGTVINNSATLSRPGGSATSNNVVVNTAYGSTPALSGSVTGTSFNSATRVFTVNFNANNNAQAGTASGAQVVTVATTNGATPLAAFPIALGNIPAGGSASFTIAFHIPNNVTGFFYDLLFQARGADGHSYDFD